MLTKYDEKIATIRETISSLLNDITKADELSLEAYRDADEAKFKSVESILDKLWIKGDLIDNEIVKTFALFGPEAKELR
ncbi:MAG: phosphate transport system protein, partial [Campylobacterota bacterium]|nr:phosphate transport system protein [Campylobacterota bacterium]